MERTPILLAFGRHWTEVEGTRQTADKRFFRGVVSPFIGRHVLGEGRRAAVIHECCVIVNRPDTQDEEERRRVVKESVSFHERRTQDVFRRTLDKGLPLPASDGSGLDWSYYFDWGFLKQVLRVNSATPGRISNIVEGLSPETSYIVWRHAGAAANSLEEAKRSILESIELCAFRDRMLADQIAALRREDPGRAIIVPRGYAHRGMVRLFDPEQYTIDFAAGGDCVPRFSSEAIIESYGRELKEHELERHARLCVLFSEYIERNWDSPPYRELRGRGRVDRSIHLLKLKAREYALRLEEEGPTEQMPAPKREQPSTIILVGN